MKKSWLVLIWLVAAAGLCFLCVNVNTRYCWLAFGPTAGTRVLLRLKGTTLYLDRDGNGKFDANERFDGVGDCKGVVFTDAESKTSYTITGMSLYPLDHGHEQRLMVRVKIQGALEYEQYSDAGLSRIARTSPLSHFGGALTVQAQTVAWELPPGLALQHGEKPN